MATWQSNAKHSARAHITCAALSAIVFIATVLLLHASPAAALEPIEVAPGYNLELVAPGVVPLPTSIANAWNKMYMSSLATGQISVVNLDTGGITLLVPPGVFDAPMGLAIDPITKKLYVTSRYVVPGGDPLNPFDVKSKISRIDRYTGEVETFVEDLPSMFFDELGAPVSGSQGIDFDKKGNLYVAQGVNDAVRESGDPRPSAILKIDRHGNVSVFATGLRAPYDVSVGVEHNGTAVVLYAGDNGEGNDCEDCEPGRPSRMYHDELNQVVKGKHYGYPDGAPGYPAETHLGPIWNFEINPPNEFYSFPAWPVPTGIDSHEVQWGELKNPIVLALFNCPSLFVPDLGTIEVFHGIGHTERLTLAKYIDGPIDVRGSHGIIYFAEFQSGNLYKISPARDDHDDEDDD